MWEGYLSGVWPLTVTQKRFFTFWNVKFVMILPMLEKLKQSFFFGLIVIKVNTDLFKKENRTYHRSVSMHTIFKIAIEIWWLGSNFISEDWNAQTIIIIIIIIIVIIIIVIIIIIIITIYLFIYLNYLFTYLLIFLIIYLLTYSLFISMATEYKAPHFSFFIKLSLYVCPQYSFFIKLSLYVCPQ